MMLVRAPGVMLYKITQLLESPFSTVGGVLRVSII